MINIFRKNKKPKDFKSPPSYEIELIGVVLAYEIARSDGDISESELEILLE